jgi:hypothetical protein
MMRPHDLSSVGAGFKPAPGDAALCLTVRHLACAGRGGFETRPYEVRQISESK